MLLTVFMCLFDLIKRRVLIFGACQKNKKGEQCQTQYECNDLRLVKNNKKEQKCTFINFCLSTGTHLALLFRRLGGVCLLDIIVCLCVPHPGAPYECVVVFGCKLCAKINFLEISKSCASKKIIACIYVCIYIYMCMCMQKHIYKCMYKCRCIRGYMHTHPHNFPRHSCTRTCVRWNKKKFLMSATPLWQNQNTKLALGPCLTFHIRIWVQLRTFCQCAEHGVDCMPTRKVTKGDAYVHFLFSNYHKNILCTFNRGNRKYGALAVYVNIWQEFKNMRI